jgi:hypothetical protein
MDTFDSREYFGAKAFGRKTFVRYTPSFCQEWIELQVLFCPLFADQGPKL